MVKKHLRLVTAAFAVIALALVGCDDDNGADDGLDDDGMDDTEELDDGLDEDDGLDDLEEEDA